MNIALFMDCFPPMKNGVITSALQLREGLEKKGHHVVICSVKIGKYQSHDEEINLFPQIPFDFGSKQGFGLGLVNKKKLITYLKKHKIDLVHTHTEFGLGFAGRYAAKKLGIPRVTTMHTMWEDYGNYMFLLYIKTFYRAFYRIYMKWTSVIVAPSIKSKKFNNMVVPKYPVQVVPNGIDKKQFKSSTLTKKDIESVRKHYDIYKDDKVIIFVGRIGPEKRVVALFNAVVPVVKKHGHVKMIFVGDGPDFKRLKKKAVSLGLQKSFAFTGFVNWDEVYRLYSVSNLFVTASLSEVHPMTMIEAMLCGLPCIARRDDSYLDQIEDRGNGYLVDSEKEMTEKIMKVLQDEKLRKKLAARSLKLSDKFSADNHVRRMEKLYKKALELYPNKLGAFKNPKILD